MRVPRLLAALVPAALTASLLLVPATTTTANADDPRYENRPVQIVPGSRGHFVSSQYGPIGYYGDDLYVSAEVVDGSGANVYGGTLTLLRRAAGSGSWQPVASGSSGYIIDDFVADTNATYVLQYSGVDAKYSLEEGQYVDYLPARSAQFTIPVLRKVAVARRSAGGTIKGKVIPNSFKRKVIVVKQATCVKCKKTRFKKVRTDRRSRFVLRGVRANRCYHLTVKGDSRFSTTTWWVWKGSCRGASAGFRAGSEVGSLPGI